MCLLKKAKKLFLSISAHLCPLHLLQLELQRPQCSTLFLGSLTRSPCKGRSSTGPPSPRVTSDPRRLFCNKEPEIGVKKCICLAGGVEMDQLWDKRHVVWTQRWLQVTILHPDVEPILSSLACKHCPWVCAEKWWNAVISCTIKTCSGKKSLPRRSAAELGRHQPLFYPCQGGSVLLCTVRFGITTLLVHLVCSWISQPLCCQAKTSDSLLPLYRTLQSSPNLHSRRGGPIFCFSGDYPMLFFVLLTALPLHHQLSSGSGPSAPYRAAAAASCICSTSEGKDGGLLPHF